VPKKSRKSRERRIMRDNSKPLAVTEVRQNLSMTSLPQHLSVPQSSVKITEQPGYNPYMVKEARRALSIWAIVIVLLIILYLILH
jgi:hypothetical protein